MSNNPDLPQPWHRITLLQLMVAVTLVAMLLSKNTMKQEYASSIGVDGAEGTEDMLTTAGWPFVYWRDRFSISSWEYASAIVGNLCACALVVSANLMVVAAIEEDTYKQNSRRLIEYWLCLTALQKAGAITTLIVCCALNLPQREVNSYLHGVNEVSSKAGFPIKFGETTMLVLSGPDLEHANPSIRILRWDAVGSNLFLAACASMVSVRCVGSCTRYLQRRRAIERLEQFHRH